MRRILGAVIFASGVALVVVALGVWGSMHMVRAGPPSESRKNVDVVLVLGASPDNARRAYRPSFQRVRKGVEILRGGYAGKLIASGAGGGSAPMSVGAQMSLLAVELGADADHVLAEGQARTTFDNFHKSFALMDRHGMDGYALV
ncbi:MAG: YdcF family protein, partial [Pseudomonadota bacterium]